MNNLRILHWNSNGIENKANELHVLISKLKIDIVLISETHLKLKFTNYHTYKSDLPPMRGSPAYGGTTILVHHRIIHQPTSLQTNL